MNNTIAAAQCVYNALLKPILENEVERGTIEKVPNMMETIDHAHSLTVSSKSNPGSENQISKPRIVRFQSRLVRLLILRNKKDFLRAEIPSLNLSTSLKT